MKIDYAVIGKRVRNQREVKKLEIDNISNLLNISKKTIDDLENGIAKISLVDFIKICDLLDISVFDILNIENIEINNCIDKQLYELIIQCNIKKQKLIYNIVNLAIKTQII
ncbi:MAG: helix-turn-helix domain-containing protein [Clostridia bacterium]|nr:helix-turn-helix transcriptional regulator [Clostridium sp.]MBS6252671.1 helix-turn-helix transcriptional regulator [Clostridium sp.]